ncbi:hypothetical protein AGMMS50225_06600 [Betaproteobacteria bacterium]|nr:hypothetical protein AGMMS50225_06600 [Betaproteobacteria bacterium]
MLDKTIPAGLAGELLSRKITGSSKVTPGRSAVAIASGTALGYAVATGTTVGLETIDLSALATVAAPAVVPIQNTTPGMNTSRRG